MPDLDIVPAEIITVGSELMTGQGLDTNSAAIARALTGLGLTVTRETSVGDDQAALVLALKRAWREGLVTVVTGGLGPTVDDLTREAAAEAFKRPLVFRESVRDDIAAMFQARGYQLTSNNFKQAWAPKGFQFLANFEGSAPGLRFDRQGKTIFLLPGVPREALSLLASEVLPFLKIRYRLDKQFIKTQTFKLADLGESRVDDLLSPLNLGPKTNPSLAMLAKDGEVTVILTARGTSPEELDFLLTPVARAAASLLEGHIFTTSAEQSLPRLIVDRLRKLGLTMAVYDGLTEGRFLASLAAARPGELNAAGLTGPGRPDSRDLSFLRSKRADLLLLLMREQQAEAVFQLDGPVLKTTKRHRQPAPGGARASGRLAFWAAFKLWLALESQSEPAFGRAEADLEAAR